MEQGQSVRSGGRSALKFSRKWVQNGDAGTVSIRTAVDRLILRAYWYVIGLLLFPLVLFFFFFLGMNAYE